MLLRHAGGGQRGVELLFGDREVVELLLAELAHGLAAGDGFFGDLRGDIVADERGEAGDHRQAELDQAVAALDVGDDAVDAFLAEDVADVGEQADRLEDRFGHHRHEDVEFEMSVGPGPGDGGLVAEDARGDHGDGCD